MTKTMARVAIVTGGSGGIGRASAERLAADGFAVVVHYAGSRTRAEETVAAVTAAGGRAVAAGGRGGARHERHRPDTRACTRIRGLGIWHAYQA